MKEQVDRVHLNSFFKFMYERHMIWYKRFVLKEKPPWTNNKILAENKFTNIYRELDAGTIWYVNNVYKQAIEDWRDDLKKSQMNLIWYTIIYRLLNRVDTFEKVGFVPFWEWEQTVEGDTKRAIWFAALKCLMKAGEAIFTSAHRTCPTHNPGETRLGVYAKAIEVLYKNLEQMWVDIRMAHNLEEVFNILKIVPNVGDFIAYEICCDFILVKLISFTEDDWVNPGPGCKKGLDLIFSGLKSRKDYQEKIIWLKDHQDRIFHNVGLQESFNEIRIHPLTLRTIEHSLCEYCKYERCTRGGKTRVKFKPRENTNGGQMTIRWPRS